MLSAIETLEANPVNITQPKRGFSVEEASEATSLSKAYLRNKIRDGELAAVKFGRRVVVLSESLDTFMRQGSK